MDEVNQSKNAKNFELKSVLELLEKFFYVKCDEFDCMYTECATKDKYKNDVELQDQTNSAVWRRILVISKAVVKVCEIFAEESQDLTLTLSLREIKLLNECVSLIAEYGISILEPGSDFPRVVSQENLELKLRQEMWEEGKLPFALKMKRLGILCKCLVELGLKGKPDFFKIIVSIVAQSYFLSMFMQFLHHPIEDVFSSAEVSELNLIRQEIHPDFEKGLFLQFFVDHLVINLLFLIQKDGTYLQQCCKEYLHKVAYRDKAFKSIAVGLLQKFDLPMTCPVMSTVIQVQLQIAKREGSLDLLFRSLATQATGIISTDLNTKTGRALATVAITSCLAMCEINYRLVDELVFQQFLHPLLVLGDPNSGPDSTVSIEDVSTCLPLINVISTLPTPFHNRFTNFQIYWNTLFAVYVATEKYLSRPVKDASSSKLAEKFQIDLQCTLYTLVRQAYRLGKDMGKYCVNMIINWKRSKQEMDPCLLEILEHEAGIVVRRQGVAEDPKRTLYKSFQDSSKYLFKFIVQEAKDGQENKAETVKLLGSMCARLFAYEAKTVISPEEASLADQLRNSFIQSDVKDDTKLAHLLDLTDQTECRKYVSTLLLAEFGSCEDLIDEFLQVDGGKDSSIYLSLMFNRLSKSLDEYELNPNHATMEFDFSRSVIFALEMLNTLCEVTYDETTNATKEKHEFQLLCTWDQVQTFVPFLTKFGNTKLKDLISLGIPDKCQDLLTFIATKGRGVIRQGVKKVAGLQTILFRINNSDISMKVSGLVDLRKRIIKQDPEILSNKELITQTCYQEMENEDPYVFMHTINVLVALGGQYHETILPKVIEEYGFGENHAWTSSMSRTEQFALRLKLGEALVKLLKEIGPAAVKYRKPVLNVCFRLASDIDPMVRESALVVLGDLCYSLELSVQSVIVQVWHSVETSLRTENEPSVLRAHFALIHKCLQGVARFITPETAMDATLGEFIRDVQRGVKFYYDATFDPVVRLHCQLCLDELKGIAVKLLTPQTELKHKIRVLH